MEFDPAKFVGATNGERVANCREFAAEAERLARTANDDARAGYFDLARKWSELAAEMEAVDLESTPARNDESTR